MKKTQYYLFILFTFFAPIAFNELKSQTTTIVSGRVIDAETKAPLSYVAVQFSSGSVGVNTDNYGRFLVETKAKANEVKVSFVGYATQNIKIKPFERNEIEVRLEEIGSQISEITVRPDKYKKKNPAVDLVREVFLHKDQNRKESLPYYQYNNYEKLRFEINGLTDKFKNKWYFKPFRFAFDFADTNKVNKKVTLPFYFRERFTSSYYRRDPFAKKEKLWAERQTAFDDDYSIDNDGISTYINSMYSDIDIYAPTITLLDKQFIGPLSANATAFYHFYITDTVKMDSQRFAAVYFSPANKNDLAFMGTMLVALDGSYAVRSVEMGVSKDINVNWLKEISIKQHFAFQDGDSTGHRLLLDHDELIFDLKIWKNKEGRSLLVSKRNFYDQYKLNQAQPDSLYKGKKNILKDTGDIAKTPLFWQKNRLDSLSAKEIGIKTMIDSVKSNQLAKNLILLGKVLGTGYFTMGPVQLGNIGAFLRYNGVEGFRTQANLRTNDKYCKRFRIRTYAAYGFLDKAWKYGGSTTLALKGAKPGRFPVNQFKVAYDHDLYFPGTSANTELSFANSLQTGTANRLLLHDIYRLEYSREFATNGISYTLSALHKAISENGVASDANPNQQTTSMELGAWLRYAPNEKFFQLTESRSSIRSKHPVFLLQYKVGLKGVLGGEYAFQRASLRVSKVFYLGIAGKTRAMVETGQIFGQVSYPLLEIHRANQSYIFEEYGFNQMNYLEFVSDRYAMLHLNHDFGGLLLNRIPLIKKLKWREGITFKALYGSLSAKNTPSSSNNLLSFPTDANKRLLTQSLGNTPYMEASAGVANIFGFLRIDYIWRLTYNGLPDVQKTGLKLSVNAEF
jgi:hypothetical protein